jgi:hypothetical protein
LSVSTPVIVRVETERGGPAQLLRASDVRRSPRAVTPLWSEGLFDPGSAPSGALYDRVAIAALLDESEPPGFTDWAVLGRIATLEIALRSSGSAAL